MVHSIQNKLNENFEIEIRNLTAVKYDFWMLRSLCVHCLFAYRDFGFIYFVFVIILLFIIY